MRCACLDEVPGYYQGPYGQLRKWILDRMVDVGGARVQMVDLPWLIEGASEGRGDGRAVPAAVRAADAVISVSPRSRPAPPAR